MSIKHSRAIAIDSETTGLFLRHGCRGFLFTACDDEGRMFKWLFRINPKTRNPIYNKKTLNDMFKVLNSYGTWIFHNSTFDLSVLAYADKRFNLELYESKTIHDTMIMAHCYNSMARLGLKPLAFLHLGYPEDDEKALHSIINVCRRKAKKLGWAIAEPTHPHLTPLKDNKKFCDYWLPYELATRNPEVLSEVERTTALQACDAYALGDVERTMGLYIYYREILERRGDYEHYLKHARVIIPTWELQNQGFHVLTDKLPKSIKALEREKLRLVGKMRKIVGDPEFNPASGKQIAKFLYDDHKLEVPKFTDKENPSTDNDALGDILEYPDLPKPLHDFVGMKMTYSKFNTAEGYMSSYNRYLVDNHLYCNLKIPGTRTLRFSCVNPNTNNISKLKDDKLAVNVYDNALTINLRTVFGPPPGYLWLLIDYTQLQLRIFAQCCQDQFLLDSFAAGADIHDTVAKEVFQTQLPTDLQRRAAKAINFGIIFGAGQNKIESMCGIPGSYAGFKARFPLVDEYIKQQAAIAKKDGFVRTLGGYPLRVEKRKSYKACNIIVQGTEGELVKEAVTNCHYESKHLPFKPVMVIHDEIIFQSKMPMTKDELPDYQYVIDKYEEIMNNAALSLGVHTTTDFQSTTTSWALAT